MAEASSILERLCRGEDLSAEDSRGYFARVVAGEVPDPALAGVLIAFKCKGETPEEIAGAARALRAAAAPFPELEAALADTCGTGGDGSGSVNISTAVALIAAEAGLTIAKHGNRSISSKCGSADVLEACGIALDASAEQARVCLERERFCFLFAPRYHAGMRHAMGARKALKTRTMFNLVGPLVNPARPRYQVMGVYDPALCRPAAETLGMLGCEAALVVHGGGLDELALHAPSRAALLKDGAVTELTIHAEDCGLAAAPMEALRGGDREANAAWLKAFLSGEAPQAHKDAVALNAGALLWVAGRAPTLNEGVGEARAIIEAGAAAARLARVAELSRGS